MCNCNKPKGPVKRNVATQIVNKSIPKSSGVSRRGAGPVDNKLVKDTPELPGETIEDRCQTLAYMLGLDEPVSERVLAAAVDNVAYMRRLLSSQDDHQRLFDLLNNPPVLSTSNTFTNGALISKAGKAMMKWALSGFSTVPKEVLKKREDACLGCPNLSEAKNILQRFSASSSVTQKTGWRTGNSVCSACGCVVHNKIRLATESCPEHIVGNEQINRWGEEIKK